MGPLKIWAIVILVSLASNCGSFAQDVQEEDTPALTEEEPPTHQISLLDIEDSNNTKGDNESNKELVDKDVEELIPASPEEPAVPIETKSDVEDVVVNSKEESPKAKVKNGAYTMFDGSSRLENGVEDGYEHIDGRVAPKINYNSNGDTYRITEARLATIRQRLMYWYYDQGGDEDLGDFQGNIHSSTPQLHKNFNFQLPFYGFRYNYTRVSMHGYLEFSDPPSHYTYPLTFPVKDWPAKADPAFIGIFFSKCRIGSVRNDDVDQRKPGVYFRLERDLQGRQDQLGVEMKQRLMWDIRKGVIGAESFDPKHAVIVTWKNMSFAGGIDNALFKTNSFQMVLATDEVFTYAIFNYAELQWSSHTEAGGDTTGGEGGVPAYIGFNAGNGTQSFEYSPYSQASVLRDLTIRGWGNNITGRHIFRIDEKILLGSCNKDIDGANLPLVFAPESGNMLGGTIVNITGPCFSFDLSDRISCRFDTEDVIGKVMDRNRAVCVQPPLMAEGYVRFEVAVNTETYKWKGKYFVETPATATEKIFFETNDVHERNPAQIKITWNSYNLTINQQAQLRISVWGYRETQKRPELQFIDVLVDDIRNDGVYTISPAEYRLRDNIFTNDMQFGFIQINLTNPMDSTGLPITPVLWSRPIPLAWYFGPQWEKLHGKKWPEKMCNNWLTSDRFYKNFAADIPLCPCTLEHALLDRGRFLPDFDCDKDANPKCFYHKEAVHCVRSGSPSMEGSGQQCCYDKYHYLMMSYDQQSGSRPHRSHNLGFLPWNEANKVPTLSHWFHDQIPYYQCCIWQQEQAVGCETYRFERRPTQDCVSYQPPGVAAIFGDPHIVTFDDNEYTFNGKGEFVLVRTDAPSIKLDVQGRFEQLPRNMYGPVMATQLTSVVAAGNSSAVIEVRMRPKHAQWRYHLDVFADGKRIYFDRSSLKIQHFPGVTVYTPTYILNQSEVIMMFQSGAGVEVVENEGYMTARVFLPWTYINKTRGLFGNWSWDPNDDFVKPDGTVSTINLGNFESAHSQFGKHWALSDRAEEGKGAALFTREFGRTASYYTNESFVPQYLKSPLEFLPSNRSIDVNRATELCGDSYQCRYDYGMSLNRDLAHFTKNYYDSVINIKESNKKRVISCGVLETPRFGRKSNFFFVPGSKVTFECSQGFVLVGDMRRSCLPDGRWDVPVYGYTECLRQQEYSSRQAGMTWAIIGLVLVPILLILMCIWVCCIKKNADGETKTKWTMDSLTPKSRVNSRANLRSLSMGNLTDTYKSDNSNMVSENTRQQSDPYSLKRKSNESPSLANEDGTVFEYPETKEFSTPGKPDAMRLESSVNAKKAPSELPALSKKKRSYEKIYRTNEPLDETHPNADFPEKKWDEGEEEVISSGSNDDSGSGTLTKLATDIQYYNQNKPKQYGRRAERISGINYPTSVPSPQDPLYVPYNPKYDSQFSSPSSPNSEYTPSQSPNSDQYGPKTSFTPNFDIQPIIEEPSSAPPNKVMTFDLLPVKKGKSLDNLLGQPGYPDQGRNSGDDENVVTFSSRTTMV